MNKTVAIILGSVVFLFLLSGTAWLILSGGETNENSQMVEYTPPPLADNPPMSSSTIDQIDREVREKNAKRNEVKTNE